MDFDLKAWGPLTVLTVAVVLLLVIGGLVNVVAGHETFEAFLNDLKPVAAFLGAGTALGRGVRLHNAPATHTARRRRTAA